MVKLDVLVVDDDDGDRKLIRRMLAEVDGGIACHEASGAVELWGLGLEDVDAIFLDYMLQDDDGLSLLRDLRQAWPRAAIMLMTGQGDEQVAKTAIQLGADDYITKSALNQNALERMLSGGVEAARLKWQLEDQRRELSTFSEVLVHDFKAPIRASIYLANEAREEIEAGNKDAALKIIGMLQRTTRQMADLVDSLAAHIRFDRDRAQSVAPVRELIDRALSVLEREIVESGASIEVSGAARDIRCFPPQISQLIQNLVANSIKFRGSEPPRIAISYYDAADGGVDFELRDHGIGIPPEFCERIFEPFRRLGGEDSPSGSGLGLATCRKIVDRHNGRIWCRSEPGKGATFHFALKPPRDP
jgi:signal transduction histidine kinase